MLIESPLGVLRVAEAVRADNAVGVMWGAEDLIAGLGGNSSRHEDGSYRDVAMHVRASTLLAAKAYGKFALDAVYLNINDLHGLRAESLDAVAVGFDVKVAIHPSQVSVIRDAFAPTARGDCLGQACARGSRNGAWCIRLRGSDGRLAGFAARGADCPAGRSGLNNKGCTGGGDQGEA